MKLYRVKYNFRAEDEGELTVRKGDLLRVSSSADEDVSKDGWTLVETLSPPLAKGYVPTNYISKADTPSARSQASASSPMHSPVGSHFGNSRPRTAGSGAGSEISSVRRKQLGGPQTTSSSSSTGEKSPTKASRLAPIRRLSDPRLPQHLLETLETSDVAAPSPLESSATMPAPPPLESTTSAAAAQGSRSFAGPGFSGPGFAAAGFAPSDFADSRVNQLHGGMGAHVDLNKLFAAHDNWLETILGEREREFQALEAGMQSIGKSLVAAREKSQDVVSKVMNLEAQVESQRHQLKLRIDEDNASMNNRFAQLYA